MSKVNTEILMQSIDSLMAYSEGKKVEINGDEVQGKQRKFVETIDLQVTLKNYDPRKDKRFNGSFRLPNVPRPNLKVCYYLYQNIIGTVCYCSCGMGDHLLTGQQSRAIGACLCASTMAEHHPAAQRAAANEDGRVGRWDLAAHINNKTIRGKCC